MVFNTCFSHRAGLRAGAALGGLFFLTVIAGAAVAQQSDIRPPQSRAFDPALIDGALVAGQLDGKKFADAAAMKAFYEQRGNDLFWVGRQGLTERARSLLVVLQDSWSHGLNPLKYNVSRIEDLLRDSTGSHAGELDLLMTDAFVRYVRDLTGMRVNPSNVNERGEFWRKPLSASDALAAVAGARDIDRILSEFEPQGTLYAMLRKELKTLVRESRESSYERLLPLSFGNNPVYPGDRDRSIPALRVRMGLAEGLDTSQRYDEPLVKAVKELQRQNGLDPDGVVGMKTLAVLNQSREKMIEQVVANLERLRWLDQERPDRYVIVNIPSQTLWAISDGQVSFEMPVIVGKPQRGTVEFKTYITGVRFNPDWTVPPTIKRVDMVKHALEEENFFQNSGIALYDGSGGRSGSIDPSSIDWEHVSSRELNKISMVMPPGENNPLGRIRIIMPNEFNIYLHDTNRHDLFTSSDRTLSSGCIRMSQPEKMAQFVLSKNPEWTSGTMDQLLSSYRKKDVAAAQRIPVYIVYQTMWQGANGRLVYGPDVYKRDKALVDELRRTGGFDFSGSS